MSQSSDLPNPSAAGPRRPKRALWTDALIADLLAGTMTDERIREMLPKRDARGMDALVFSALRAARIGQDLTALLGLLEPPSAKEKTELDVMVTLLERIAESQIRIERRLDALESAGTARSAVWQRPLEPGASGSPR